MQSIDKPIAFLCVCGKYRTGKSYLLNKVLLGNKEGFSIGNTIHACTKGLWLWKRPLKYVVDEEEIVVFVIDTEGLGALDEDDNHDTKVVLLGLLLSSLMLYNSMGSIDENALNSLSLVINISKTLQEHNANGNTDEEEFAKNFPIFLWILRDFSLQLKDPQGNQISPKQYLENALAVQKGNSEAVENKNKVRRLLKYFFPDRDCATLVRPTENEGDLQNLINLPDDKLRKEFIEQVNALKIKVKKKLRAKVVNGKKVNGPMLASLCAAYTEAINSGKIPSIDNAWSYVCKSQCEAALNEIQTLHATLVDSKLISKLPCGVKGMREVYKEIEEECMARFKEKLVSEISNGEELAVRNLLNKLKKISKEKVMHLSKDLCGEHLEKIHETLSESVKNNEFASFQKCKEEIFAMLGNIPIEIKESPGYHEVLAETLFNKVLSSVELFYEQAITNIKGENKLLSQRVKGLESENLSRKTEALKDKELYGHKLQEAEEDRMKLKTKETILEERNRSLLAERERQEEKLQKEVTESKAKLQEVLQEYQQKQQSYDKDNQALRDDSIRKELEANKTIALLTQQVKYMEEKIAELTNHLTAKENDITVQSQRIQELESSSRQMEDQLKSKEKKLAQIVAKGGSKTSRQKEGGEGLEIENAVLKKQLEIMQEQVTESRKIYDNLLGAINSNKAINTFRRYV